MSQAVVKLIFAVSSVWVKGTKETVGPNYGRHILWSWRETPNSVFDGSKSFTLAFLLVDGSMEVDWNDSYCFPSCVQINNIDWVIWVIFIGCQIFVAEICCFIFVCGIHISEIWLEDTNELLAYFIVRFSFANCFGMLFDIVCRWVFFFKLKNLCPLESTLTVGLNLCYPNWIFELHLS